MHPRYASASSTTIEVDRAHRAQVLREDHVGVELGERTLVEAVEVLARGDARADHGVDLRRRQPSGSVDVETIAPAPRFGRVIALERHPDEIVAPTEREHDLGRRREQGDDAHAPMWDRARRQLRTRRLNPLIPSQVNSAENPISAPYTAHRLMCGDVVSAARKPSHM